VVGPSKGVSVDALNGPLVRSMFRALGSSPEDCEYEQECLGRPATWVCTVAATFDDEIVASPENRVRRSLRDLSYLSPWYSLPSTAEVEKIEAWAAFSSTLSSLAEAGEANSAPRLGASRLWSDVRAEAGTSAAQDGFRGAVDTVAVLSCVECSDRTGCLGYVGVEATHKDGLIVVGATTRES
jgi:hypothetical protein